MSHNDNLTSQSFILHNTPPSQQPICKDLKYTNMASASRSHIPIGFTDLPAELLQGILEAIVCQNSLYDAMNARFVCSKSLFKSNVGYTNKR